MSEPDVVAALTFWIQAERSRVGEADNPTGYIQLMEKARDEIVALRRECESRDFSFDKEFGDRDNVLAETAANARSAALEEAARVCERRIQEIPTDKPDSTTLRYEARICANAIRALKDKSDE